MWEKLGLIFNSHHAQLPTPQLIKECVRIYYSSKDAHGRSYIRAIDCSFKDRNIQVLTEYDALLLPGERGCFDDSGVMPSCVVSFNGETFLYYSGWNVDKGQVPYGHGIGLAKISENKSLMLERLSIGPILDRGTLDPYLSNSAYVVPPLNKSDPWRMWYCRGTGWNQDFPAYGIASAKSNDGINWIPNPGFEVFNNFSQAIARPWIEYNNKLNCFELWCCSRQKNTPYRVQRAISPSLDGPWIIDEVPEFFPLGDDRLWDGSMTCYPATFKVSGNRFILYNGNGYGATGIGAAIYNLTK